MSDYRLYFMDNEKTRIERFEPIEAANDFDAIMLANSHIGLQPLELWLRARKVMIFSRRRGCTQAKESRAPVN